MHTVPLRLGAGVLIGGCTAIAFFSGGFFEKTRLVAMAGAWILVAVAALFARRPLPVSTAGRVGLAGLVLLCALTALSITWAPVAGRAEDDLQRLLLYTGVLIAALAFLRDAAVRVWIEPALALGALVATLFGLSERLLPGLVELHRSRTAAGRLEQPVTYWNGLGILAVVGLILAVRIAGDPRRPAWLRGAAAAGGVPLGLAVYLTFARGALAALAVGLLVLVAVAPAVRDQLRSIVAVIGAGALAALASTAFPTVKSLTEGAEGDSGDGLAMLGLLVVLAAFAAAAVLRRPRRELAAPRLPASRPVTVLSAAAVVLIGGALAVALLEGKPKNTSPAAGADPTRLASIDTNRYGYWEVAVREFAEHPLLGVGSGGFAVEWLKERDRVDRAVDAHSLYFETATELGLAGLCFLLTFMGGVAAAGLRLYRLDAAVLAGPAAALGAWAFHAGLDWDWEMPAVTLPALLLAATVVAASEETPAPAAATTRPVPRPAPVEAPSETPARIC